MARKPKKYHYIYKTTCKVTGKFYVGMHSSDLLEDGYLGSGKILGYSRKKYGDENHVREILEFCSSRDELKQREKEIVNEELLADPLNINLKYGGEGGGCFYSPEHQRKCSSAGGKSGGARVSWDRHRERLAPISANNLAQAHIDGKVKYDTFTGKVHSQKTKDQMSESHSGTKNSQFGTCWVSANSLTKKIPKSELADYLSNGYSRGRK